MPLTQAEVDGLLKELGPLVDTPDKVIAFGMGIYNKMFHTFPDYIPMFSKLQGLTIDNVMQSEGIKYYGRTLAEELVAMLKVAANEGELKKLCDKSADDHTKRNVTKAKFMVAYAAPGGVHTRIPRDLMANVIRVLNEKVNSKPQ